MHKRFLAVLAVTAFVLTLLFAAAAGAQEDTNASAPASSNDGESGIQVRQVQQQQVGPAAADAPFSGPLATKKVKITKGKGDGVIDKGDVLKINGNYDVRSGTSITIENQGGEQGVFVDGENAEITETDSGLEIRATKDPRGNDGDPFELNIDGEIQAVTSDGVSREGSTSNNNGNTVIDDTVNVAQTPTETTTAETTTAETTTATTDPSATTAETTTAANADGVRNADAFRCEFFLRVHRDDRGGLHQQYQNDDVVVQRFEQCVSADVLASTIPDRRLPFTGGMPLLGLAALGLASLVAGASVLRAVTRRGR